MLAGYDDVNDGVVVKLVLLAGVSGVAAGRGGGRVFSCGDRRFCGLEDVDSYAGRWCWLCWWPNVSDGGAVVAA